MKVERTGPLSLLVDFADEDELQAEQRSNLAVGGLFLRTTEAMPQFAAVEVRLRLPGRGETTVKASVVGAPPGALALQLLGDGSGILAALLAAPVETAEPEEVAETADTGTLWARLRAMTDLEVERKRYAAKQFCMMNLVTVHSQTDGMIDEALRFV